MNKKIANFSYAFIANALNFVMGFVTGFLLPKFLGIDDYAYLKLFTFYIGYIGLLHFGFLDGIYIRFGAYNYDELPREKFRGYFKFLVLTQVLEAIIFTVGVYFIIDDPVKSNILYLVILNMIILNVTNLFSFVHQFTKRFKLFSINLVLSKLIYIIGCVLLFVCGIYGYNYFVILQTIINILILGIYIMYNKEIVFGKSEKIFKNIKEYFGLIRTGLFVMLGNFISILILGIDRIFVDRFFTLADFGMYSFAYSLISLFYILMNSLTTVMYPYLTRAKEDTYKETYETIRTSITILMGITLGGYFAIEFIIINFLSKYTGSLPILIFLVPTVIFNGQISILMANFYKVLRLTKEYTINNIVALIVAAVANVIAYAMFKSVVAISIATLISFIIWILYTDLYFKKKLKVRIAKSQLLDITIVLIFLGTAYIPKWYIGAIVYVILFVLVIGVFYRKEVKSIIKMVKK